MPEIPTDNEIAGDIRSFNKKQHMVFNELQQ